MIVSPVWWLSVVVAGIAINVLSAYLKTALDSQLSAVSSWWRRRSEKESRDWEALISRLSSSDHEEIVGYLEELRERNRAIFFLVLGIFVMGIAAASPLGQSTQVIGILLPVGAMTLYASFKFFRAAIRLKDALFLSRYRRSMAQPESGTKSRNTE